MHESEFELYVSELFPWTMVEADLECHVLNFFG